MTEEPLIDGMTLRRVMRQVPSPVVVVTAAGAEETRGITIGSLASVSLEPPLICFNVNQSARMHDVMVTAEHFAVNVVTEQQAHLCRHFARADLTGAEQFEGVPHHHDEHGTPILEDVQAVMYCRPYERFTAGDHSVIVGAVTGAEVYESAGAVVYYRRAYRGVGAEVQSKAFSPVKRESSDTS